MTTRAELFSRPFDEEELFDPWPEFRAYLRVQLAAQGYFIPAPTQPMTVPGQIALTVEGVVQVAWLQAGEVGHSYGYEAGLQDALMWLRDLRRGILQGDAPSGELQNLWTNAEFCMQQELTTLHADRKEMAATAQRREQGAPIARLPRYVPCSTRGPCRNAPPRSSGPFAMPVSRSSTSKT
jgi:hypothetical protein